MLYLICTDILLIFQFLESYKYKLSKYLHNKNEIGAILSWQMDKIKSFSGNRGIMSSMQLFGFGTSCDFQVIKACFMKA